jgi:hypothetical protein
MFEKKTGTEVGNIARNIIGIEYCCSFATLNLPRNRAFTC